MSSDTRSQLAVSVALSAAAATFLILIVESDVSRDVLEVFAFFAGATAIAALATFSRLAEPSRPAIFPAVRFDYARASEELSDVIDADYSEVSREPPWEPTPDRLLHSDPTLAMAAVRIELERQLRRLSTKHGVAPVQAHFTFYRALMELQQRDVIPKAMVSAVQDILPVVNRAVHGADVDPDTAAQVVEVARSIAGYLAER